MSDLLTPIDAGLPVDAAFMARTELSQLRRLGMREVNLDTITGHLLGVLGRLPSVRHQSCVTDEILNFLTSAGLRIEEDIRIFRNADEAERHADALIAEGFRLFGPYPLRLGRFAPEAQLVSADLWQFLNSKRNLGALVPPEHLAPRQILQPDEVPRLPTGGAYLKFAGTEPTGSGYAVRHCPDDASFARAIDWFRAEGCAGDLLMEHAIDVVASWGVTLSVAPEGSHFLGAAEQLFETPGRQSNSVIDPTSPLPDRAVALACRVGDSARERGFVGIAGLDIGLGRDGRLVVFDPNFRFTASTGQILLHPAAAHRSGLGVSLSFNLTTELAMPALMRRLSVPIGEGWVVPTRLVDGRLLSANAAASTCTGFVMGETRATATANLNRLQAMIAR